MAGKNRGGRSVGDDDSFDDDTVDRTDADGAEDAFDDEELDEAFDEAFDDDADAADEETEGEPTTSRRRSKVLVSSSDAARAASRGRDGDEKPGFIRNIPIFVREVFAELQKVIWPTRKELLTYTSVVVVFVAIMMTIVGLLDLGFAKGLLFVFGSTTD